jgi:hypothetical protein
MSGREAGIAQGKLRLGHVCQKAAMEEHVVKQLAFLLTLGVQSVMHSVSWKISLTKVHKISAKRG